MKKVIIFISSLGLILSNVNVLAQNDASKPEVKYPIYFDVSPPLRDMVQNSPKEADNSWKVIRNYFNVKKNVETFPSDWIISSDSTPEDESDDPGLYNSKFFGKHQYARL